MIVEFSVKNFRSIKDLQTISFVATGLKSSKKYSNVDKNNIAVSGETNLFKTIGIYGANASGKSNIVKALDYFVKIITKEPSSSSILDTLCEPFLFQNSCQEQESHFQIVLIIENEKYRYGFTVKKNPKQRPVEGDNSIYSTEIITSEWLIGKKITNDGKLFIREKNEIKNYLPKKEVIPPIPYDHSLLITHIAAFDRTSICEKIRTYLRSYTISNIDNGHDKFRWLSIGFINNTIKEENKEQLLNLLASFNLKYKDATLQKEADSEKVYSTSGIIPQDKISFSKEYKPDENQSINVKLNLFKNESAGTQKLFDLAGLLLRAFRLNVPVFIILDEIDSNFHPSLLIKLIKLFNDPEINKSNSQLLFTSHDTNLMSPSIMRRDQFYFTEKNDEEFTRLYSLADLKGIRNDADFAKQYLAGYYGALPILENYSI